MKETWNKLKDALMGSDEDYGYNDEFDKDYLEVDAESSKNVDRNKVKVKTFVLKEFQDVKGPLDALREGYTIALVNVRDLKSKDLTELKRAVNKLKKTCEAIDGDIAGFGEDWIVATPSFAEVYRQRSSMEA